MSDLSGCYVGENVDYPGDNNPYSFPDPPFDNWAVANPSAKNHAASLGAFYDTHGKAGGFSTPYCVESVESTQIYRYKSCDDAYTTLMGPISITRSVYWLSPSNIWEYEIEKSGDSATMELP